MRYAACLLALALASCASESSPTSEPQHAFATFCADRATRCPDAADVNTRCAAKAACLDAITNPIHMPAIIACYEAETCETDSEQCLHMPYADFHPTAAWTAFETRCNTRDAECSSVNISDDVCDDPAVSDEYIARVDACLDEPCDQILNCFQSVIVEFCPGN